MEVKAIPKGYESVIPHLIVKDAAKAIDFYKKIFGINKYIAAQAQEIIIKLFIQ